MVSWLFCEFGVLGVISWLGSEEDAGRVVQGDVKNEFTDSVGFGAVIKTGRVQGTISAVS